MRCYTTSRTLPAATRSDRRHTARRRSSPTLRCCPATEFARRQVSWASRCCTGLQRGGGGDHLERRARWVGLRDRPVQQRVSRGCPAAAARRRPARRRRGWPAGSGRSEGAETIARILPVDGSSATTAPVHGPLQPSAIASHAACCTCGIDGGRHIAAARIAAGEEVGEPPAEQSLVGAVEDGVLGALQPGAASTAASRSR